MPSFSAVWTAFPVSTLLLAGFVTASLLALFVSPAMLKHNLFRPHGLVPRRQWPTPVASAFLHADLAHLFFNGLTFRAFGFRLERGLGSSRFAALHAVGLAASAACTWLKHRHDPGYRCLGASGAILAMLFASIVCHPESSIYIPPIPVPIPTPLFAALYLAYTWWAARQERGTGCSITIDGRLRMSLQLWMGKPAIRDGGETIVPIQRHGHGHDPAQGAVNSVASRPPLPGKSP